MAFPDAPPILETPRLVLRALRDEDASALYAIHSDPVTMRYWATPPWSSPDQAQAMLARARDGFAAGDALRFAVIERDGDALVGTCTLFGIDATHRRAEVGYVLARERWGRGVMREALTALLDYAFGPLGLHRVEADVDPRNVASVGLLERLGFAREGLLRERWRVSGEVSDSVFLGLLEPAWRRSRAAAVPSEAAAAWPDDWRTFHLQGLECLVRSGRATPALFAEAWNDDPARLPHLLPPKEKEEPWLPYVASRMLAGVGAELLLRGLYLKRGIAPGGEAFDDLLADRNLVRLGAPKRYAPIGAARAWRDDAARTALGWAGGGSADKYAAGLALRSLHFELLDGADAAHRDAVARVFGRGDAE